MVQSLLADRFKLRIHHEARDLPEYALVLAKNGPKMKESTKESSLRFGPGEITATAVPARAIAQVLSRQAPTGLAPPELEGREVHDETGLSGVYDFTLKWTPESSIPATAGTVGAEREFPGYGMITKLIATPSKYSSIPVPALFIFANPHSQGAWVNRSTHASVRSAASAYSAPMESLVTKQENAIKSAMPMARVGTIRNAHHFVYLSNEPEALREVRNFLLGLN